MTDDKLLPLPDWAECCGEIMQADLRDYARANVAERDAEIARLRERVEKLEAALRLYMAAGFANSTDFYTQAQAHDAARAALADGEAASA